MEYIIKGKKGEDFMEKRKVMLYNIIMIRKEGVNKDKTLRKFSV